MVAMRRNQWSSSSVCPPQAPQAKRSSRSRSPFRAPFGDIKYVRGPAGQAGFNCAPPRCTVCEEALVNPRTAGMSLKMETGMSESDDDALQDYGTALQRFLTYFDGPERVKDPDWWDNVIRKEDDAWWEVHRRGLLDTDKYFAMVLGAHRLANRVRVVRERRQ
jgi:hypothetical protein